jgi:TnpA family transposase
MLAGRESTYTLDEVAHNPILEIERHTTDSYGSTDLLFALFDLIGKTFHPRIRDLQSHVDYRLGPGQSELQVDQTAATQARRSPRDHHRTLGGDAARRSITGSTAGSRRAC